MSRFDAMLNDLCEYLGADAPEAGQTAIELTVDGAALTLTADNRSGEEELMIYTSLGHVPAQHEMTAYRAFLEANLFWSATGDATLGVNSATKEAFIAYRFPEQMEDTEGLVKVLAMFLEIAQDWRTFVRKLETQGESIAQPDIQSGMLKV